MLVIIIDQGDDEEEVYEFGYWWYLFSKSSNKIKDSKEIKKMMVLNNVNSTHWVSDLLKRL